MYFIMQNSRSLKEAFDLFECRFANALFAFYFGGKHEFLSAGLRIENFPVYTAEKPSLV